MTMIGHGSHRTAVERQIPLPVWNHPDFQRWLTARQRPDHMLTDARVLWLQLDAAGIPVGWVLKAQFTCGDQESPSSEFITFGDLHMEKT
ncbi:hypothetical protein [Actinoplanes awajinensis]|uniref:Uncharacterized protein n=1 Tax=Actinoplanes awajinensis subsp. mycoplanecinus TaxID=135947 RepID=A0A101JCS9_9ACTN|nr:hypothetical protein [Actinoplanes awajinensis]KUL24406.1 hypothetical protein ADL15_43700 [Actinoplanes awajinensis subsp. mycoplanecinus]